MAGRKRTADDSNLPDRDTLKIPAMAVHGDDESMCGTNDDTKPAPPVLCSSSSGSGASTPARFTYSQGLGSQGYTFDAPPKYTPKHLIDGKQSLQETQEELEHMKYHLATTGELENAQRSMALTIKSNNHRLEIERNWALHERDGYHKQRDEAAANYQQMKLHYQQMKADRDTLAKKIPTPSKPGATVGSASQVSKLQKTISDLQIKLAVTETNLEKYSALAKSKEEYDKARQKVRDLEQDSIVKKNALVAETERLKKDRAHYEKQESVYVNAIAKNNATIYRLSQQVQELQQTPMDGVVENSIVPDDASAVVDSTTPSDSMLVDTIQTPLQNATAPGDASGVLESTSPSQNTLVEILQTQLQSALHRKSELESSVAVVLKRFKQHKLKTTRSTVRSHRLTMQTIGKLKENVESEINARKLKEQETSTLVEEASEREKLATSMEGQMADAKSIIETLRTQAEENTTVVAEAKAKIETLGTQAEENATEIAEANATIESLGRQAEENATEIAEANATIESLGRQAEENARTIAEAHEKIETLRTQAEDNATLLANSQTELLTATSTIEELRVDDELARLKMELEEQMGLLKERDAVIQKQQADHSLLEVKFDQQSSTLQNLLDAPHTHPGVADIYKSADKRMSLIRKLEEEVKGYRTKLDLIQRMTPDYVAPTPTGGSLEFLLLKKNELLFKMKQCDESTSQKNIDIKTYRLILQYLMYLEEQDKEVQTSIDAYYFATQEMSIEPQPIPLSNRQRKNQIGKGRVNSKADARQKILEMHVPIEKLRGSNWRRNFNNQLLELAAPDNNCTKVPETYFDGKFDTWEEVEQLKLLSILPFYLEHESEDCLPLTIPTTLTTPTIPTTPTTPTTPMIPLESRCSDISYAKFPGWMLIFLGLFIFYRYVAIWGAGEWFTNFRTSEIQTLVKENFGLVCHQADLKFIGMGVVLPPHGFGVDVCGLGGGNATWILPA